MKEAVMSAPRQNGAQVLARIIHIQSGFKRVLRICVHFSQ